MSTHAGATPQRVGKLSGKVALVTGAGRGLGKAYAVRLAGLGADVVVTDRDLRSFEEFEAERDAMAHGSTAAEVRATGADAMERTLDVTDPGAVEAVVEDVVGRWGRLDVVVCNAGGVRGALADSRAGALDHDDLLDVLALNLLGTINTCRAAARVMERQASGKLITVASAAGLKTAADGTYTHYGIAKTGVIMYTRCLARDLGPRGITANCIAPGMVGTGRLMVGFEAVGLDTVTAQIPLGRIATVDDIANVVEFLATDLSDYVNGAVIPVDGGLVA